VIWTEAQRKSSLGEMLVLTGPNCRLIRLVETCSQSFGRLDLPEVVLRQFADQSRLGLRGGGVIQDNRKSYF